MAPLDPVTQIAAYADPYAGGTGTGGKLALFPGSIPDFRALLLHGKEISNEEIERLTSCLLDQLQTAAGPSRRVGAVSGRDSFLALASGKGKKRWSEWANAVSMGWTLAPPIEPLFQVIVVPANPLAPYVGRGAALVVSQALSVHRAVRLWDPDTGNDWPVGSIEEVNAADFRSGWRLSPPFGPLLATTDNPR